MLVTSQYKQYWLHQKCLLLNLAVSFPPSIVIPLLSGEAFHDSYKIVPLICLGSILYGMASMADAGILTKKKTGYKPFIFGSAAAAGILFNFLLVPSFGGYGAAVALALTFLILLIVNYIVSNKFYYIHIEYSKMLLIFGGAVLVYFISTFVFDPNDVSKQILSVLTFLLYPVILWFGGLLSTKEKELLLQLKRKRS